MKASEIIKAARRELGVSEYPPNSNNVKYNTAYYEKAVSGSAFPWCMAFIWWLFFTNGASSLLYGGNRVASCTQAYSYHLKKGEVVKKDYTQGDLIFYDWDKSGDCDHVGLCVKCEGEYVYTIEGNTAVGNNSNGGEVMLRKRKISLVKGAIRPAYEPEYADGEKAYEMLQAANKYASELSVPNWAKAEFEEAVKLGITDGTNPMQLIPRYQAAIMAMRAGGKDD